MARPLQRIKVYGVQDRRNADRLRLPWVVRYTIDGTHRSRSYRTKAEAERYRGALLQAVQDGDRFDLATGEPESWQLPLAELSIHQWTRRWLAEQWPEWQPRSRTSASEALARFVILAVGPHAEPPQRARSVSPLDPRARHRRRAGHSPREVARPALPDARRPRQGSRQRHCARALAEARRPAARPDHRSTVSNKRSGLHSGGGRGRRDPR
jgi:hypothetical protein